VVDVSAARRATHAKWSWAEFGALPQTEIKADIHCVTKWSKLDTRGAA
jgi:DMSO/TMAO reductase YedYZ molybdopterin-dependent catalytic subunit